MALSGSFTTSAYSNRSLTFSWTATQSIVNNQSEISWTLKGSGSQTKYFKSGNFKVVIAGETVYSSADRIELYNGTLVASGKKIIKHNDSTGKASFSASVEAGIYYVAVNCSGSGSWELNTIARASVLDSLTCNTSYLNGTLTYKYTPKNNTLYNRLRISIPNVVKLADVNLGTKAASQQTGTYTLTTALLESIYNRYPSNDKCTIGFAIETYSNSSYTTKIGESVEKTIDLTFPLSVAPSIGNIVWTKTSTEPSAWPMTQGISKGTMSMSNVSGAYGSTIKSYSLTFAGLSSSANSLTVNNIASSGKLKAVAKIVDTRGRPATKEVEFDVSEYTKPTLSVSTFRCDNTGAEDPTGDCFFIKATAEVTEIGNNLLQQIILSYKRKSDTQYNELELMSEEEAIIVASSDYSWDLVIVAEDLVSKVQVSASIPTGEVILDILANGKGIGLGKVAEREGLDSAWDFMKNGVPQIDYPIERGTEGIWTYEKWASGKAECYGRYSYKDFTLNAAGAATSLNIDEPFPFVFAKRPVVNATLSEEVNYHHILLQVYTSPDGVYKIDVRTSDSPSISKTVSGVVNFDVKGQWK